MMQNERRVRFRYLCFIVVCTSIELSGCRKVSDGLEGEPLSEVLLRYTPQVGQTNRYKVSMNLDKKFCINGRWQKEGNSQGDLICSFLTVEQTSEGYRTKFDADEESPEYSVMYHFTDEFPFVDEYVGTFSFEGCAGTKKGPRVYDNQHKMTLIQ